MSCENWVQIIELGSVVEEKSFPIGIGRSIEIEFLVEGCPRVCVVLIAVVVMPEAESSDVSEFESSVWSIDSVED